MLSMGCRRPMEINELFVALNESCGGEGVERGDVE